MNFLVTGASGFIGQHVVQTLLNEGHDVTVITRDPDNIQCHDWADSVDVIAQDLNGTDYDFYIADDTILIHLAWEGLPNYHDTIHFEKNVPSSFRLIKHCVEKGVKKVLVTGTCFEYGMRNGPLSADLQPDPQNAYAIAKDTLRKNLECLQRAMPFTLHWARLFYMYGPGQNPKSILALLDTAIDNGDEIFNMSGGEQLRDYLHIHDVARGIYDLAIGDQQGCFNICSGKPISIRRLVEDRIKERGASITMNLGHYPYPDYEPMAFWGEKKTVR